MLSLFLSSAIKKAIPAKNFFIFTLLYCLFTFVIVPVLAPFFGREKVAESQYVKPASYTTILLNRNYVKPELNTILVNITTKMKAQNSIVKLHYLDANFPFVNGFPLLPHLSHNDGKKLDLSLIYEDVNGKISGLQKSVSGYGIFEEPKLQEFNQTEFCIEHGYYQYDFPKYLTLGTKNSALVFSEKGTKQLMNYLLAEDNVAKVFLEKHLKDRLQLTDSKIRFQGCGSVRHDDHIHIQL